MGITRNGLSNPVRPASNGRWRLITRTGGSGGGIWKARHDLCEQRELPRVIYIITIWGSHALRIPSILSIWANDDGWIHVSRTLWLIVSWARVHQARDQGIICTSSSTVSKETRGRNLLYNTWEGASQEEEENPQRCEATFKTWSPQTRCTGLSGPLPAD